MTEEDDIRDGILFRLWVRLATNNPSKIAVALAKCVTEGDYRAALMKLARETGINLP